MGTFKLGQTPPWEIERIARRYVKRNRENKLSTADPPGAGPDR